MRQIFDQVWQLWSRHCSPFSTQNQQLQRLSRSQHLNRKRFQFWVTNLLWILSHLPSRHKRTKNVNYLMRSRSQKRDRLNTDGILAQRSHIFSYEFYMVQVITSIPFLNIHNNLNPFHIDSSFSHKCISPMILFRWSVKCWCDNMYTNNHLMATNVPKELIMKWSMILQLSMIV